MSVYEMQFIYETFATVINLSAALVSVLTVAVFLLSRLVRTINHRFF